MRERFDRRVVSEALLGLVRACQARVPCHLGGGVALAGAYLGHRATGDLDLFVHDGGDMRHLVGLLPEVAAEVGLTVTIVRDVGHLVRARAEALGEHVELDIVHEPVPDIAPAPESLEGVAVESLADLRANKLTCILSRSEPRDLVDLFYLHRAGFPAERDLSLALRKDSGTDPGVLAWLLAQFPVQPLPRTFEPLTVEELTRFRDELGERLRRLAVAR